MTQLNTVFVPKGYTLQMVTDAYASGVYTRLSNPGGTINTPVALAASADVTIGPFSEPRNYVVDVDKVDGVVLTVAPASVISSTDIDYVIGVTSDIQTQLDAKRPLVDTITTLSVDGAIAITAGIKKITKAGVCALTLAAPVVGDDGKIMTIISRTANAHTVTVTGLLDDGVTGGSKNAATFAAFAGASITLMAIDLKWQVVSSNNVTVA